MTPTHSPRDLVSRIAAARIAADQAVLVRWQNR